MSELHFNWEYKDYKLLACPRRLARFTEDEPNETIALMVTGFSLAHWRQTKCGFELIFVGSRPFEHIAKEDLETVWDALKQAQEVLDEYFSELN